MCEEMKDEIQKTYSSFKSLTEVCEIFDYEYEQHIFIKEKEFEMNDFFKQNLIEDFLDEKNFANEYVICERIISPILSIVSKANNLPLWSHIKFEFDKSLGLTGEFDYMLAPKRRGTFTTPVVCLGEAKRDDFVKGWAQVGAEMIAAQKANKHKEITIYGLVSTGNIWQFGYLKENLFTIDPNFHATPVELNKVFNILNWVFCEARKNADKLIKITNINKK